MDKFRHVLVVRPRQIGKTLMMQRFGVQIALEGIAEARAKWTAAKREFDENVSTMMGRLLHEAAANHMSAEDVAKFSGLKVAQVRSMMRLNGLDPKQGKTLLAKTAADALANNAELLGIAPHEMDLMSPLAYLPMGKQMKRELRDQTVSQVHELEEVSGNEPLVHGINYHDHEVACGHLAYNDPVLVTSDLDKLTCEGCKRELIKGYDWASE